MSQCEDKGISSTKSPSSGGQSERSESSRLRDGQAGQAMAEYAIVTFFMVVGLSAIFSTFLNSLGSYTSGILSVVALPFP